MTLIRHTQLAPAFSGAPVPLNRPTRYGDGPVVRAKAKKQPEPALDPADAPATRADIVRIEEQLAAILEAVEALRDRVDS